MLSWETKNWLSFQIENWLSFQIWILIVRLFENKNFDSHGWLYNLNILGLKSEIGFVRQKIDFPSKRLEFSNLNPHCSFAWKQKLWFTQPAGCVNQSFCFQAKEQWGFKFENSSLLEGKSIFCLTKPISDFRPNMFKLYSQPCESKFLFSNKRTIRIQIWKESQFSIWKESQFFVSHDNTKNYFNQQISATYTDCFIQFVLCIWFGFD